MQGEGGDEEEKRRNLRRGREGGTDYGIMVRSSQQHVAPYVKGVEWEGD